MAVLQFGTESNLRFGVVMVPTEKHFPGTSTDQVKRSTQHCLSSHFFKAVVSQACRA